MIAMSTSLVHSNSDSKLNRGFGEYEKQELHNRKITCGDRIRALSVAVIVVAIAATILGGTSALIGFGVSFWIGSPLLLVSAGAITGASIASAATLMLFIVMAFRKDRKVPSTSSLNLDAASHAAPVLGSYHSNHSLLVTKDVQETLEWKMHLIRSAQQSIELSGNFCGGHTFRQALKEIGELLAERPALKFHLISSEEMLSKEDFKAMNQLKESFPDRVRILVTNSRVRFLPRPKTVENHVKLLIIDGKYFVAGGTSFQDIFHSTGDRPNPSSQPKSSKHWTEYLQGNGARDMDFVGRGDLAKTMRLEFYKLWAIWEYKMSKSTPSALMNYYFDLDPTKPLATVKEFEESPDRVDDVKLRVTVSGPEQAVNQATEEYRRSIAKAKERVRIGSLTFNPANPIRNALLEKIREGVDVEVITNGTHKYGVAMARVFTPAHLFGYTELVMGERWDKINDLTLAKKPPKNKVHILEFGSQNGGKNVLYHKKVMTVDKEKTLLGSYNQGRKSHYSDHELLFTVKSSKIAEIVNQVLDNDRSHSQKLPRKRIRRMARHPLRRLIANVFQMVLVNIFG